MKDATNERLKLLMSQVRSVNIFRSRDPSNYSADASSESFFAFFTLDFF